MPFSTSVGLQLGSNGVTASGELAPLFGQSTQFSGTPNGKTSTSTSNWGSVNWGGFNWGAACPPGNNCKSVAYDSAGVGNITSKSDVGAYSYPSGGSARPHAVSSITGTVDGLTNPIYSYDADGNLTCVSTVASCGRMVGRQVTVTSFNMTDSVAEGGTSVAFTYDSEHQRIAQACTTAGTATTTVYMNDPASGAVSEEITVGSGTPNWTDYIKLEGQIIAQRAASFATPV